MPYFKHKFKKGSIFRNVLTLMTGTALSQIIPIAVSPILTRLYTPMDFGTFTLFTSIAAALAVVATGRYELAIMLPKKEEEAINLVALCAVITTGLSLLTFLPMGIFNNAISNLLGDPNISNWLYLVPFVIFLTGFYQTLNFWSNRKKQYQRIAISRVLQSTMMAGVSLGMGILKSGASGLILGAIFGQGLATGQLAWQNWREDKNKRHYLSKTEIKNQAHIYRDFPRINSIHALIDMLQLNGIVFFMAAFFGGSILGYYTLTMRVLKVPLNFIGKSIGQVFYQKASEIYNQGGDLKLLVQKTIIRLALIAAPIFIVLFLFAPVLFSFTFGQQWHEAGQYTQILSPWLYVNFIISPVSQLPLLLNRQKTFLIIGFLYDLSIILLVFWGGFIVHNIFKCFYLLSITLSLFSIYILFWLLQISKTRN